MDSTKAFCEQFSNLMENIQKTIYIRRTVAVSEADTDRAVLRGAKRPVRDRCAVIAAADTDPMLVQPIRDLSGQHSVHGKRHRTAVIGSMYRHTIAHRQRVTESDGVLRGVFGNFGMCFPI